MTDTIRVRPARPTEVVTLARLVESRLPDMMSELQRTGGVEAHLSGLVPDQALVVATHGTRLAGLAALDIDQQRVLACYLDPETASPDTPRRLFRALETRALRFGIRELRGVARKRVAGFMRSLGYEVTPQDGDDNGGRIEIVKDLLADADEETVRTLQLCDELEIPPDYGIKHRLPMVPEATELISVGKDIFDREQRLIPTAAQALGSLYEAAASAGIELKLVSGFRPVAYQANLFKRKLGEGQTIEQILRVSAAPGFSEHHSGRAIDLTTRGCKPLEADFADTQAYGWLLANGRYFGFRESYPRNNRHGISWEPWHWYYFRE